MLHCDTAAWSILTARVLIREAQRFILMHSFQNVIDSTIQLYLYLIVFGFLEGVSSFSAKFKLQIEIQAIN